MLPITALAQHTSYLTKGLPKTSGQCLHLEFSVASLPVLSFQQSLDRVYSRDKSSHVNIISTRPFCWRRQASVFDYLLVTFCEVVHVTLEKHLKCCLFSSTWSQISLVTQWPGFYWKIKHLLSSAQHSSLLEAWTRYLSWWQCWAQLYRWGEGPNLFISQ